MARFSCRQYYKEYYGIDFGSDFVIHHMDFNSKNNDIKNLLLLPKKLYSKYMFILNGLNSKSGIVSMDFKISNEQCGGIPMYGFNSLKMLCETMEEVNVWVRKKSEMDIAKYREKVI